MRAVDVIAHKRDGLELSTDEIAYFVRGICSGEVADYQASAWAMAVLLRGMSARETTDLTMAMVHSGQTVNLSGIGGTVVDKHSTGGVGDKTTLIVAPMVAAVGLPVAKMSGRGLGFSGGTLDKLEAIPGFNVSLTVDELIEQVARVGIALAGQTAELAPADAKLYALRDVTATVPSLALIASSIMSKKIAGGADAFVLDVKVGRGAFMSTLEGARELAELMIRIGAAAGRRVTALLSDMNQPLGCNVGNAIEVVEAIDTLRGRSQAADLLDHCLVVGSEMLLLGGRVASPEEGRAALAETIGDGSALATFRAWIAAQGGDERVVDDPRRLPHADVLRIVPSPTRGYAASLDALEVALAAVELGAGRARKGDTIDHSVGIELAVKVGGRVEEGQPLFTVHARDSAMAAVASERVLAAYTWSASPVPKPPLIHGVLREHDVVGA
ncbi:MAG: thymidine phosphorylase [Anaerolineae bacterium]